MRSPRDRGPLAAPLLAAPLLAALLLAVVPPSAAAQPAPASVASRSVPTHDAVLHYEEAGAGEPLLLLHGFGGCAADWRPFVDALAARYRVIMPDLRGHGRSPNPSGTFTMRQSAGDVLALLDSLGIARARAMGISAGGMTLLHLATREPDRLSALVLVGASSYFPPETRAIARSAYPDSLPPPVLAGFGECAPGGDAQVAALLAQFRGFADSYDDVNFTPPLLSTIRARTLIVHGDRDEFFPVEIPVGMYGAIPGSALWIVPGGNHVPIYDPLLRFADVALRFLAEPEAPGAP